MLRNHLHQGKYDRSRLCFQERGREGRTLHHGRRRVDSLPSPQCLWTSLPGLLQDLYLNLGTLLLASYSHPRDPSPGKKIKISYLYQSHLRWVHCVSDGLFLAQDPKHVVLDIRSIQGIFLSPWKYLKWSKRRENIDFNRYRWLRRLWVENLTGHEMVVLRFLKFSVAPFLITL